MKSLPLLLVLGLLAAPNAHAVPILGEWTGTQHDTFASNGELNDGLVDLFFTNQDANGTNIAGRINVVCTTGTDCGTGGFVDFSGGTLLANILTVPFAGGQFGGALSDDGNSIEGHYSVSDASGSTRGDFHLSRVTVPEPTTISLLCLGIAGLAFPRRKHLG